MPSNIVEQYIKNLQEQELEDLESKKQKIERFYLNLSTTIKQSSEISGVPEETLVRACIQAAWHYQDLEWHQVMEIVRSVFLAKKNIEENNG